MTANGPDANEQPRVLFENEEFRLLENAVFQQDARARVVSPWLIRSSWRPGSPPSPEQWVEHRLRRTPEKYPQYRGDLPILEAAYNLAVCELEDNTTPEGLLITGATWNTVWTRDAAYSIHLGLAAAAPRRSMDSLRSRVRDGEIMQDTGTGGSWPISTDRISWALAAWSLYQNTGDRDWLQWAAGVIEKTLRRDEELIVSPDGLVTGESSFLDWREQSYPGWMTTADIGSSCALGTMALHMEARSILARMQRALGHPEEAASWQQKAERIKEQIDQQFWSPAKGQYGQYLYGRGYPVLSERSDTLAQALCILFGIAMGEKAQTVASREPRSPFGAPVFSPYRSDLAAIYHNRAVWPFVEGYALWAAGTAGDPQIVARGMASLLRAAILFGTNKENFSAETGASHATVQNSDRQLWSIAGMLSMYYHTIFGLQWDGDALIFTPCIPKAYGGDHWLTGLRLRGFTLDVHIHGYGSEVCRCLINGQDAPPVIDAHATGLFVVELELNPMDDSEPAVQPPRAVADLPVPAWLTPEPGPAETGAEPALPQQAAAPNLQWHAVEGADAYIIYRNGVPLTQVETTSYDPAPTDYYAQYQIQAVSRNGAESYLSEPWEHLPAGARRYLAPCSIGREGEYTVENAQAWIDAQPHTSCLLFEPLEIENAGDYRIELLYCNATDNIANGDTCALRDLILDHVRIATLAMPHNSTRDDWSRFSFTAPVTARLEPGRRQFKLLYTERDRNQNGRTNQAMVRSLRLTRLTP